MSITRVKPAGWAVNEKLTSGQQNLLDINVTYALDKRAGQTDTLASDVTVSGDTVFNGTVTFNSGFVANSFISAFNGITNFIGPSIHASTVVFQDDCTFQSGCTFILQADFIMQGSNYIWNHAAGSADVMFKHVDLATNGATAQDTYLQGRNATGTTSTGGDVYIQSGSGTQFNGNVRIYSGATNVAVFGQNSVAVYKRTSFFGTVAHNLGTYAFGTPNVTMDMSTYNHFFIGAATADTFLVPSNPVNGAIYTVSYLQDGTGGHNIGWGGGFTFHFGSLGTTPDATASKRTTWVFLYNTDFYCLARNVF